MKVISSSALHTGHLYLPGIIPAGKGGRCYSVTSWVDPKVIVRPEGLSMKNSRSTIGNRTRDLPTYRAVPQPTAQPRGPSQNNRQIQAAFSTDHSETSSNLTGITQLQYLIQYRKITMPGFWVQFRRLCQLLICGWSHTPTRTCAQKHNVCDAAFGVNSLYFRLCYGVCKFQIWSGVEIF
jgi:hypothetical protein